MTKTLTEQWREETLPDGCYYVEFYTAKTPYIQVCGSGYLKDLAKFNGTDRAKVLAPVPSYDEYKRLQEQLNEANEILMMPDNIKYHDEVVEMLNNYIKKWGVK